MCCSVSGCAHDGQWDCGQGDEKGPTMPSADCTLGRGFPQRGDMLVKQTEKAAEHVKAPNSKELST